MKNVRAKSLIDEILKQQEVVSSSRLKPGDSVEKFFYDKKDGTYSAGIYGEIREVKSDGVVVGISGMGTSRFHPFDEIYILKKDYSGYNDVRAGSAVVLMLRDSRNGRKITPTNALSKYIQDFVNDGWI